MFYFYLNSFQFLFDIKFDITHVSLLERFHLQLLFNFHNFLHLACKNTVSAPVIFSDITQPCVFWQIVNTEEMNNVCGNHDTKSTFHLHCHQKQMGTCIMGLIWPPLEPKTESCFSSISSFWFIRRMVQV